MNPKELKAALRAAKEKFNSYRERPSLPSFFAALVFADDLQQLWQKFMAQPVPQAKQSLKANELRKAAFANIMVSLHLFLTVLYEEEFLIASLDFNERYIIRTATAAILADVYRRFRQKILPLLQAPAIGIVQVHVPVDGGEQVRDILLLISGVLAKILRESKDFRLQPFDEAFGLELAPSEKALRELNSRVYALSIVLIAEFIDIGADSSGQVFSEIDRATQFMSHILSLDANQYAFLMRLGSEADRFHSFFRRAIAALYIKSTRTKEDELPSLDEPSPEERAAALQVLDQSASCCTPQDLQIVQIRKFFDEWRQKICSLMNGKLDEKSLDEVIVVCQSFKKIFSVSAGQVSIIPQADLANLVSATSEMIRCGEEKKAALLKQKDEELMAGFAKSAPQKKKKDKEPRSASPAPTAQKAVRPSAPPQQATAKLSREGKFLQQLTLEANLLLRISKLDAFIAEQKITQKHPLFLKFQLQRAEWLLASDAKIKNYKAQLNILKTIVGAQDKPEIQAICEKLAVKIAELIKLELDSKLAPIYALLAESSAKILKSRLEERLASLRELAKNPDYTADVNQCIEKIEQRIKALFKDEIAADLNQVEKLLARPPAEVREHEYLLQWKLLRQLAKNAEYHEFVLPLLEQIEAKVDWSSLPNMELSKEARAILKALNQHWSSYAVGGLVRDGILGCKIKDEDLVCLGDKFSVFESKEAWDELQKALVEILKRQDVSVGVSPHCENLLVIKLGSYPNQQRFEVFFSKAKNCEEDALTRDFSLNAMYLNDQAELAYAPAGAIEACKKRELIFVNRREFYEDPVRLLRGWALCLDDFHFSEKAEKEFFKQQISNLKSKNVKELKEFLGENLGRFMAKFAEVLHKAAKLGKAQDALDSFNCPILFGLLDINGKGVLNQYAEYRAFLAPSSLDLADSTDSASPRSSGSGQAEALLSTAQQGLFAPPNGVVSPAARQMRAVFSEKFAPNG